MGRRNRFFDIPRNFGGYVYAAELKNGIVKVGFSCNPRTRMSTLSAEVRRNHRTTILRWYISRNMSRSCIARTAETALIARMQRLGTACAGTVEYFKGVSFGAAVTLVNQVTRSA